MRPSTIPLTAPACRSFAPTNCVSRTLDRVEQTSDMVHKTVISPVRQLSGLMQGITVGLEFLFGGRARKNGGWREERRPVPQDEMFI